MDSLAIKNMDLQPNLELMENSDFEEKVDIEDLVLPSKPTKLSEMEILDIKEETFEVYEEEKTTAFESVQVGKKQYKLKIEETILKLYDEFDREKYENPMMDVSQRRQLRIREVVEELELYVKIKELENMNNQMAGEIASLKAELQIAKISFANSDSIAIEIKSDWDPKDRDNTPFSCKFCDKYFFEVHKVNEHVKLHASIIETKGGVTILSYDKDWKMFLT
jgi:hypothetical protein